MDTLPAPILPVQPPSEVSGRGFRTRLLVALGLACAGCFLFAVDIPVARWCRANRLPKEIVRLVDHGEVFGYALSVAVILLVTIALDPIMRHARRVTAARWDIGRLVLATYAGGLVVDILKHTITRVRPRAIDLAGVGSVFDTFGTFFWTAAATSGDVPEKLGWFGKPADLMSFPSGHAAVAAGLATALAWKYPHGWPIFAALAALATAQRLVSGAHYPSDVAFGAACGVAMAAICLAGSRPKGFVLP